MRRRDDKIATGLQKLEEMDRVALAVRWEAHIKRPPPKAASRVFLLKALSFELQSKQVAGLSKSDLKALSGGLSKAPIIKPDDTQLICHSASKEFKPKPSVRRKLRSRVKLVPGARLVREWSGQTYTVSVIDEGFVYKNRTWSSLSAIAKDITGAHWSGPRFFGLDKAA
jgi:hypothetical protein